MRTKEERLASLIAKSLPHGYNNGEIVLEIGCGEGNNLYYLKQRLPDIRIIGVDFSFEKMSFLTRHFSNIEGLCADVLALPFKDGVVDLVLCRDLLHHVNSAREGVVSEALRVLKSKGVLVIFESNGKTILNRIFQFFTPAERGMKDSTVDTLTTLGKRHGEFIFEYIEASFLIRGVGYFLGWTDGVIKYFIYPLYFIAFVWEKFVERFSPKRFWSYFMMTIIKNPFGGVHIK